MHHAITTPEAVHLYGLLISALYIRVDTATPRLLPTEDSWHSEMGESLSRFGQRCEMDTPYHLGAPSKRTIF
jgi:hypothetical protein